jgi:hypothetical protein
MQRTRSTFRNLFLTAAAIVGFGCATASHVSAATVTWATWSSFSPGAPGTAAGTLAFPTPVNIGYSGEILSASYLGTGPLPPNLTTAWTGTAYTGGNVANAPSNLGQIALKGGTTNVNTVIFSPPVINPVMAIWSLGSAGSNRADFDFTAAEPFTVEAGGTDSVTGGQSISALPNIVFGIEGNGVIQFAGTYSSLTWTNPILENDYAFTLGADGVVPEPASMSLLALAALSTLKRRRRRA